MKIPFDIKIGITRKAAGYSSENNKAVENLQAKIENGIGRVALSEVARRVGTLEDVLPQAIADDLQKFAQLCVSFFFSQRASSATGAPRRPKERRRAKPGFSVNDDGVGAALVINPGAALDEGLPTDFTSSLNIGNYTGQSLIWPGLRSNTLERKKRMGGPGETTYFIYTDQLAFEMKQAFGDVLAGMFNPTVTFVTAQNPDDVAKGIFRKGGKIARIKARLFKNQGDAAMFNGAFQSGNWTDASDDRAIITRFLEADIGDRLASYKLNGNGHSRSPSKRPWVGPAIAFWVLNRAPMIVEATVARVLKEAKLADRAAAVKAETL